MGFATLPDFDRPVSKTIEQDDLKITVKNHVIIELARYDQLLRDHCFAEWVRRRVKGEREEGIPFVSITLDPEDIPGLDDNKK